MQRNKNVFTYFYKQTEEALADSLVATNNKNGSSLTSLSKWRSEIRHKADEAIALSPLSIH